MPENNPPRGGPTPCFLSIPHLDRTLHIPHRSRHIPTQDWAPHPGPIKPEWHAHAAQKGFRVRSRIRDRLHLVLECRVCGALTAHHLHTLRTANPACGGCQHRARVENAQAAGLTFLHRDPESRHHGYYRAACGHVVRRNFGFIERVMRGEVALRCENCLQLRDAEDARKQGWTLIDRDPQGDDNYRLYEHSCGHRQRVARVNMSWGQVDCARCGASWTARRSFLYLVRLTWADQGLSMIKLGYSANPKKRFRHQLGLDPSAQVDVLRSVALPTGHLACTLEKRLHADLRERFPDQVIPQAAYAGLINVVTEIYHPDLTDLIRARLDEIARDHPDS